MRIYLLLLLLVIPSALGGLELFFSTPYDIVMPTPVLKSSIVHTIEVQDGQIDLKTVEVGVNETVVWVNAQEKLPLFLIGVREIIGMRSPFLQPGEVFRKTFTEKGEFTYVDGIMIGRTGKIIVN